MTVNGTQNVMVFSNGAELVDFAKLAILFDCTKDKIRLAHSAAVEVTMLFLNYLNLLNKPTIT